MHTNCLIYYKFEITGLLKSKKFCTVNIQKHDNEAFNALDKI